MFLFIYQHYFSNHHFRGWHQWDSYKDNNFFKDKLDTFNIIIIIKNRLGINDFYDDHKLDGWHLCGHVLSNMVVMKAIFWHHGGSCLSSWPSCRTVEQFYHMIWVIIRIVGICWFVGKWQRGGNPFLVFHGPESIRFVLYCELGNVQ